MYSNLRLYFYVFGYPLATQNKKIPIFANKGIPKETMSFLKTFDLPAHWSATASVAADDIVPIDVRYAGP